MKLEVRRRLIGTIPLLEVVAQEHLYEKLPLIVYYHGWQTQKELVLTQGRKLAQAGFRVVLPDAANHGDRKNPVSTIPSLTFWQSIQTNLFEFELIVNFFRQLDLLEGWIGVGGVSMGGMTTCGLLTQHPEISAAACVMGSPSYIKYREALERNISKRGLHLPKDYHALTQWIESYDLETHYASLPKRPLFFWHGKEDEKIPFEQVSEFIEKNADDVIIFDAVQERHLVKGETMTKVTDFFRDAYEKSPHQ
ncbi:alpha/beta fold hydrolase [Enterococcus olivae]